MDFPTAIKTCFKEKYFDFTGRASRSEYWFFLLFFGIIASIIGIFAILFRLEVMTFFGLLVITIAIFLPPLIGVTARRLHDVNLSGWWQLAPVVPAIFSSIFFDSFHSYYFFNMFLSLASLMNTILFAFYVRKSDEGENRFGYVPAGISEGPEMDIQTAAQTCLKHKFCTFKGRASRSEFWQFILFYSVLQSAVILFASFFGGGYFEIILLILLFLALVIPTIAATARRLHDTNRSGWWQIAPFASIILFFIFAIVGADEDFLDFSVFITVILAIVFSVFLVLRGTEGDNRFDVLEDWEIRRDEYNNNSNDSAHVDKNTERAAKKESGVEAPTTKALAANAPTKAPATKEPTTKAPAQEEIVKKESDAKTPAKATAKAPATKAPAKTTGTKAPAAKTTATKAPAAKAPAKKDAGSE